MVELVDTHCHIQEAHGDFVLNSLTQEKYAKAGSPTASQMVDNAVADGVTQIICVGTTLLDSQLAVEFAQSRQGVWAGVGLHPHEAKDYARSPKLLEQFARLALDNKVCVIGECGLDFYYNHSLLEDQEAILRFQIDLALKHNLPMSFHVRDAFDDFWRIFDGYKGIKGAIHSFSSTQLDLQQALRRGLYIGLNGITTFMKDAQQLEVIKAIPLDRILMETDAPYLTPTPYRGKLCEPKHVRVTAEFLASLRGESLELFAAQTTLNAKQLFNLK